MRYAHPGTEGAKVSFKSKYGNYIGGEFVAPVKGQYFTNTSPVNGQPIAEFPRSAAEDIDKALKLGLNHPMGPFEMVDLVGLDTRLSILRYLHQTLGEKFRPAPLLEKFVAEGRLGRKVGRGVFEYPDVLKAREAEDKKRTASS